MRRGYDPRGIVPHDGEALGWPTRSETARIIENGCLMTPFANDDDDTRSRRVPQLVRDLQRAPTTRHSRTTCVRIGKLRRAWYDVQYVNSKPKTDREFAILEHIDHAPAGIRSTLRQRDLARIAGISLGMTNIILRRLAKKGWVTIRRINGRNLQYAISVAGMEEIARRSYRFLRRTFHDIAACKDTIHALVRGAKARGFERVVLVGRSDIDFMLEHCCARENLAFERADAPHEGDAFVVYGENIENPPVDSVTGNPMSIRDLAMRVDHR